MSSIGRDLVLTETEVRAVLERAVLIEAKSGALSVPELERVASEAGISTDAIHVALREILESRNVTATAQPAAMPVVTTAADSSRVGSYAYRIILCAAIGFVAGEFASSGNGEAVLGAGVLFAGAVQRAFRHRSTDTPAEFQGELLVAWSMFCVGFGAGNNEGITADFMIATGFAYIWAASIGALISASKRIPWRFWKKSRDVPTEPGDIRV
jgi:hypothetical protein